MLFHDKHAAQAFLSPSHSHIWGRPKGCEPRSQSHKAELFAQLRQPREIVVRDCHRFVFEGRDEGPEVSERDLGVDGVQSAAKCRIVSKQMPFGDHLND
jgi:hypothetical protein